MKCKLVGGVQYENVLGMYAKVEILLIQKIIDQSKTTKSPTFNTSWNMMEKADGRLLSKDKLPLMAK